MTKEYTMREIVDHLTIVFHKNFKSLTNHVLEEVGEIMDIVIRGYSIIKEIGDITSLHVRGQDINPRIKGDVESNYKMSEIYYHISEFAKSDQSKIHQFSEFYRWNKNLTNEKFYEKLEKELIDVIMEVGLYLMLLDIKKYDSEDIEDVYSYKFLSKEKRLNVGDFSDIMINVMFTIVTLIVKSRHIDKQNKGIKISPELINLLIQIERICIIFGVDINKGIHNKLNNELKDEKRSNV